MSFFVGSSGKSVIGFYLVIVLFIEGLVWHFDWGGMLRNSQMSEDFSFLSEVSEKLSKDWPQMPERKFEMAKPR